MLTNGKYTFASYSKSLMGRSFILAVIVHMALLVFLWVGISWQNTDTPEAIEAEVWDVKVREAAPLAAGEPALDEGSDQQMAQVAVGAQQTQASTSESTTASTSSAQSARADISLGKTRETPQRETTSRSENNSRSLADKQRTAAAALMAQEASRIASGRGGSVRGSGGGGSATSGPVGSGGNGTAARSTGPGRADGAYIQKVAARIRNNTNYAVGSISGNTPVVYDVVLFPDGSIRSISKRHSSGVSGFDDAVKRAIERSAPYPKDRTGRVPSSFLLTHRPKG